MFYKEFYKELTFIPNFKRHVVKYLISSYTIANIIRSTSLIILVALELSI